MGREMMFVSVTKIFKFEMGHVLSESYSKECKRPHGHSYTLETTFENQLNPMGMVMDFKEIKEIVDPIIAKFDHQFLNEENFGKNPTAENIAQTIFAEIREKTHNLVRVKLWETDSCFVEIYY